MNKTIKIISILLLAIIVITIATNVLAADKGQIMSPSSIEVDYTGDDGGLKVKAGKIVGMIRNIAVIAAVIILTILGIKYMLGSVEEKAEYKKSFMPLIVGVVVVVASTQIASFIFNIASTT